MTKYLASDYLRHHRFAPCLITFRCVVLYDDKSSIYGPYLSLNHRSYIASIKQSIEENLRTLFSVRHGNTQWLDRRLQYQPLRAFQELRQNLC
jgi:hypothetical protein